MTVSELAEPLPMSLAAASKHIRVLEESGLLRRDVQWRTHLCTLNAKPLVSAQAWLDFYEQFWDERFAVNLRHQFFAAQAVAPGMAAAGGGAIVNFGSVSWIIGQGGMPAYLTAKAAVAGLTRALARDLGPMNIRVNCIVPGWIMTERQITRWLTPEGEQELMRRQCLKRKLLPEDIARVVLFFAADHLVALATELVGGHLQTIAPDNPAAEIAP